jgi:hypothetical protein
MGGVFVSFSFSFSLAVSLAFFSSSVFFMPYFGGRGISVIVAVLSLSCVTLVGLRSSRLVSRLPPLVTAQHGADLVDGICLALLVLVPGRTTDRKVFFPEQLHPRTEKGVGKWG